MLHYGIGALLIILIITITLSYHYNAEGFAVVAAAKAAKAEPVEPAAPAAPVAQAPVGSGSGSGSGSSIPVDTTSDQTVVAAGPGRTDLVKSKHSVGTIVKTVASQANKENNIDSVLKKDKLNIKSEYRGNFLRLFAQMPSLADVESQRFWLISDNPEDAPIWKRVFVTNDSAYESAAVPQSSYEPYIGQTVYLVPRGSTNPDDAYGSFVVPNPSKPTVVNPKVSLSDTGYNAMRLNKHSNLLNDIQKIIHNEMLANRSLDVIVKNANNRSGAEGSSSMGSSSMGSSSMGGSSNIAKSISQLPPKIQAKALAEMQKNSCDGSCGGTCDSCQSDNDPDMSKYIRKDQIPCYGCSLDY